MFGGINPSKMQGMMKKMGISQEDLNAKRVIFELGDKNLVIENPSVIKIKMQGQESYQVTGEVTEEEAEIFLEEDLRLVIEKTNKSEEEARAALEESDGDIAEAIIKLKE